MDLFLEVVWRHNLDTIVTLGATGADTRCSQFPAYSKMNSLNRLDSLPPTANNGTSTTTAAPRQPGFLSRLIGKGAPRAAVSLRGSCTTRTDSSAAAVPATIEYRPHVSGDENSHGQIWQGRTFYHCPHHGKDGMMVLHAPHQCQRSENGNAATTSNPVPPNDWLESMASSANGQLRAWYLPLYQRREIYQRLPDVLLGTVLEHAWEDHPAPPPEQELEPSQQVTWLLQDHVRTALNVELDVHSRKAARDRLTLLLCLLDEAEQEYKQPQQEPVEVDPSQELINSTADDSLEPAVETTDAMQVAEDDAPATNAVEEPSREPVSLLPPTVTAVATASSGSSSTTAKPSSLAEGSVAVATTTGQRDPPPAAAAPPPYERRSSAAVAPRAARPRDKDSVSQHGATRPTAERSHAARRSSNASTGSAHSDTVDHRSRSNADRPRAPPARQSSTASSTASSHRDADYRSRSDADRAYAPPVRHSSTGSTRGEVDYRSRSDADRPAVPPPYAWERKQIDSLHAAAASGDWKVVPPGPNEPSVQYRGVIKYHWCPYHRGRGVWSRHDPAECRFNPANKTPSPLRAQDKQSPPEVTRQNTSPTTTASPPEPQSLREEVVSQGRKRPRSDQEVEARPAPSLRNVEARPTPSPPKPIDPKLEKYRNDMVARRTALKNAIPKAIWPPRDKPLSINFMEDAVAKGKRGGFRRDRKPTVVAALARPISVDAGIACMDWLESWEPFWQLLPEAVMQVGSTYVAEDKFGAPEVKLNTTAQLTVYVSKFSEILGMRGMAPKWGKPYEGTLSPGDTTLLLHMAPLSSVMTNKVGKHLWPLGTFLVIDGSPVKITQRDQNLDDKWYGPSLPLDVTQYVKDPKKPLTIELGCHESVPFVYCLAVHKYRTVGDFIETLRLSMSRASPDDGAKKVCSLLKTASTTICIDTDEDEPDDKEVGKLVFSLRCPLTREPIKTPIRGKNCKHFQVSDILFPM
jgi:hypothetical protein